MPTLCCFLLAFFLLPALTRAQQPAIEAIPNQPSPEAYDLLKDSRGYLWIAHDLGVSRYDGATFVNFHHPQQNSLSMTDLLEDKKGRIWCHNFSGQIFYIENLQLHLLEEYKYAEEIGYPRMVLCGDELIASSVKGLFVYNTLTGKSRYIRYKTGISSIARIGNKVVGYSNFEWCSYEPGKSLVSLTSNFALPRDRGVSLQTSSLRDTFYMIVNSSGNYFKLTVENNSVRLHSINDASAFINTISVHGNQAWVNTKQFSFTTDGKEIIRGVSLSDVIDDQQGHRWMSSLKRGLCVQYNARQPKKLTNPLLGPEDDIRSTLVQNAILYMGSSSGKLYRTNASAELQQVLTLPKEAGALERLAPFDQDRLVLAPSIGLYLYNSKAQTLQQLQPKFAVKDIAIHKGSVYLATPSGIVAIPVEELANVSFSTLQKRSFDKKARCRSFTFLHDSLIAVYNDGVFISYNNKLQQLFYKQQPIYAAKVRTVGDKALIGTYNQGLLILENGRLRRLTENDGLASDVIRDIKSFNGATWLIYNNRFQQLKEDLTGVEDHNFPFLKVESINDFSVLGKDIFLATANSVYIMPLTKPKVSITTATHIDQITANGKPLTNGNLLKHNQNYLQFQVSTPFYSPYTNLIYQYRIRNAPDSSWQRGAPGQSAFDVVALEPGVYDFEIMATDDNHKTVSVPAVYRFEIEPPWYQRWVFRIVFGLMLIGLGVYTVWLYYRRRLRQQRIEYQKMMAVQAERQRISSEIHDDVGAGLSALRLLTELTKSKLPENETKREVEKIHDSLSELSHKMREVIWSLNTDNDKLENLLYYIRRQALQLFENSPIQLKISFPPNEIPAIVINGEKRRHIYLAVKEALHNCLKHSEASVCELTMRIEGNAIWITVADDGKGFGPLKKEQVGNGLPGMQKRVQHLAGMLEVQSQERTVVKFIIPLIDKHE